MEENKSIYELELNEVILIEDSTMGCNTYIRRVPKGWIYTSVFYGTENTAPTSSFVPYDAEFKEKKPARAGIIRRNQQPH